MNLCLVMIGRFEDRNGFYYGDKKNINAIERYLKYFDKIHVVARRTNSDSSIYPRQRVYSKDGRIVFHLYNEVQSINHITRNYSNFKNSVMLGAVNSDMVLCWAETKTNVIHKIANKLKKPFMIYVGGCNKDILFSSKSFLRKVAGLWVYYINKNAIKKADYVHYVTGSVLQKRYPTNGKSIGASYVNIKTDITQEKKEERINKYNSKLNNITLGIIGYLNEVKGIDTAIKALSKLDSRFNLKVLGGGEPHLYKKLARNLGVEDRVLFEGTLSPGEPVLNWLDNIDIYLQPSRTEGLPRATIEAMSRGCPVISSNAMGLVELVEEEWRHNSGDWQKLTKLVDELASDSKILRKQAERSFNVAQKYDRALLDQSIDLFFRDILESERGAKRGNIDE